MTEPSCSVKAHLDISTWNKTSASSCSANKSLCSAQCCSSPTPLSASNSWCVSYTVCVCMCVSASLGLEKSAGLSGQSFHGCLWQTQPVDQDCRRQRKNSTNHPHYKEIKNQTTTSNADSRVIVCRCSQVCTCWQALYSPDY